MFVYFSSRQNWQLSLQLCDAYNTDFIHRVLILSALWPQRTSPGSKRTHRRTHISRRGSSKLMLLTECPAQSNVSAQKLTFVIYMTNENMSPQHWLVFAQLIYLPVLSTTRQIASKHIGDDCNVMHIATVGEEIWCVIPHGRRYIYLSFNHLQDCASTGKILSVGQDNPAFIYTWIQSRVRISPIVVAVGRYCWLTLSLVSTAANNRHGKFVLFVGG